MFYRMLLLLVMGSPWALAEVRVEGPWLQGRKLEYRYVTVYNVEKVQKPLPNFPWIEEDCHDTGSRFANWSQSVSYEITYGGGLNFSLLGFMELDLGAERSKGIEFNFQRWITPTEGIRARHQLYEEYENWVGHTYMEVNRNGVVEAELRQHPFSLTKLNYGIFVKREVLEVCK